jgi:hypothetical protein
VLLSEIRVAIRESWVANLVDSLMSSHFTALGSNLNASQKCENSRHKQRSE